MNIKLIITLFPFIATACSTQITYSGYYEKETLATFPGKTKKPFLYCGNTYFKSSDLISELNTQGINRSSDVIAITSMHSMDGPQHDNHVTPSPLKCRATIIFADRHEEQGYLSLEIAINDVSSSSSGENLAQNMALMWKSDSEIEKSKIQLREFIRFQKEHPQYECYTPVYCSEERNYCKRNITYVSDTADCKSGDYSSNSKTIWEAEGELKMLEAQYK